MARGRGVITQSGGSVPVAQKFNSAEEISGRDKTTKQSAPTHFSQIGSEDSGKSPMNDDHTASLLSSSGNKFSDFKP